MTNDTNNTNRYSVPKPVGQLLSMLPVWPGSLASVSMLNAILVPRLPEDVREVMMGRHFRLVVTDAMLTFNFIYTRDGFVAGWGHAEPDLTISASLHDFYLLSKREEDPDTLFFSRRLIMEGDTELGLLLKNTLDAMDLNVLELIKAGFLKHLATLVPGQRK